MIRIAVLETEDIAKTIIFELGKLFQNREWSFQYFTRISDFVKADTEKQFQVIIFHEKFHNERITKSFVIDKTQRVVIYTKQSMEKEQLLTGHERILFLRRKFIEEDLTYIFPQLQQLLRNQDEYLFSYNNIEVPLKIKDIYYIEKEDKVLIYHTRRGEFRERKNMREAEAYFDRYQFLRIHASYLVNFQYILKFDADEVCLQKERLPFARARRKSVREKVREYTKPI